MCKKVPWFKYFPYPLRNGCIVAKEAICECCGQQRQYMYTGPIYCTKDIAEVCPWCIVDCKAAAKWSACFNDIYSVPGGVPEAVLETIAAKTPGYSTWRGNRWLFSEKDALVFVGEVVGAELVSEKNQDKIQACLDALKDWQFDWTIHELGQVVIGGQPAIYLFEDKDTGAFSAYAYMT